MVIPFFVPTRGSFAGFLPLVRPKTHPPGAVLRGFCPWCFWLIYVKICKLHWMSHLTKLAFFENIDQGQFCGVFAPGQPNFHQTEAAVFL
jgi:hypothetical protein